MFAKPVVQCLAVFSLFGGHAVLATDDDPITREVVVELFDGENIEQVAADNGCTTGAGCLITERIPAFDAYLLRAATPQQATSILASLLNDPRVDDAEPHDRLEDPEGVGRSRPILDRAATPSDFRLQPAAQLIRTAAAHQRQTARNVVVAVLDTGIELGHDELVGHTFDPRGFDFAGGRHWAWPDPDGIDNDLDGSVDEALHHGTVVAGLINLAAPNARILAIRVLDEDGRGTVFGIANGILLALEQGADVINLSFGSPRSSSLIRKAIQEAVRRGVVVVTAAGNRGVNEVDFPCSHSDVICVAAVDDNKQKAVWSNYGSRVDLTAPGNLPLSAFNLSEYAHWDGTSFAAPLVSGAAALLIEKYPGLTPDQIRWSLKSTTQPDNSPEYLDALGTGVLDAAAVTALVTSDRTSLRVRAAGANSEVTFSELQGVTRYDIARGEVGRLRSSWDRVELGSLVCLADNTTTRQALDAAVPIAGTAQFYLFRASTGSYGFSSSGLRREATGSDCNAAP